MARFGKGLAMKESMGTLLSELQHLCKCLGGMEGHL